MVKKVSYIQVKSSSVKDLVACSGELADCKHFASPSPSKPVRGPTVAVKIMQNVKGPCLVIVLRLQNTVIVILGDKTKTKII